MVAPERQFPRPLRKRGAEGIDVTQARRLLRLTLLAPVVVDNLLANPDAAVNLESVLRQVMPLDWQAQGTVFSV